LIKQTAGIAAQIKNQLPHSLPFEFAERLA